MRFTVLGASNEKSIFCHSDSFRISQKKLQLFEKYMKSPNITAFPSFVGVNDKDIFFVIAKINPLKVAISLVTIVLW